MTRPTAREIAKAREILRDDRKARKADRVKRVQHKPSRADHGREFDAAFLSWLHEGLPCIACLVLEPSPAPAAIEAAHQKINAAERGVWKRLGVRPSDKWCVPLCRFHHREGSPCCDPAQAKFWVIVGLMPEQVADFCTELYAAFEQDRDGAVIVRDFASLAAASRADAQLLRSEP